MNRAAVGIPLPLLSALQDAESAFFGVFVETGKLAHRRLKRLTASLLTSSGSASP